MADEVLRRTALYDAHRALGARMVPFGGYEMPVQYAGILAEHEAVRKRAGLFDLSHMGQFGLRGAGVGAWADALTINLVSTIKPGQARYNVFTNDAGGAYDDVIFYRFDDDEWLLVVNAANADVMWAHLEARRSGDVVLTDLRAERALIAVQGPRSLDVVQPFVDIDLAAMKYYGCAPVHVGDGSGAVAALVARTGYTGEDGFEVFLAADAATGVWDTLLAAGRDAGLAPCGLGARDVLRLEAGMPLYGHELTAEITPLQAGIGWAIKYAKPAFTGRDALLAQRDTGDYDRIVGVVLEGRVPARAGYPVYAGNRRVGEIRSGSWSPAVEKNIATALVPAAASAEGTALEVEVRGTRHPAVVTRLPFYKRAAG